MRYTIPVFILFVVGFIILGITTEPKIVGCTTHTLMPIQAKTIFYKKDNMLKGTYTYQYTGGTVWQREFTDYIIAWGNQAFTGVQFRRLSTNADFTFSFHKFNMSMIGKWALGIPKGEPSTYLVGVNREFIGTHNHYYPIYTVLHEIYGHLIGYFHGQDVSNPAFDVYDDLVKRPFDPCSYMTYSEEGNDCPHPFNWLPTDLDYERLDKDFGLRECFIPLKEWMELKY